MTDDVDSFVELCKDVHQLVKDRGYGVTGIGAVNWPLLIAVEGEKIKGLEVTDIDGVRIYFEERAMGVKGRPGDIGYGCDEWAEGRYQHAMENVNNFIGAATCPHGTSANIHWGRMACRIHSFVAD